MKPIYFVCVALGVSFWHAESSAQVKPRVHFVDLSSADQPTVSKSQTVDPDFNIAAPLGLPRNGVPFQMDYKILATVDNLSEGIDYFAFNAPSGWTITAISSAPAATAAECVDGDPHTGVIGGFSATSAYWGGDYGGGVVTPGTPGTYPGIGSRSGCGPYATTMNPALADTHTFSVTMTPSAPGECPGSTTGALPLCCGLGEISGGDPPPSGSEPYFNEMRAATDEDAEVFGDGWYYVALQCPPPFILLDKFAMMAPTSSIACENAFPGPDTLTVPLPPGDDVDYCYDVVNYSNLSSDPWVFTSCDSLVVADLSLGDVFDGQATIQPGDLFPTTSGNVSLPAEVACIPNVAQAACWTAEGSDWVDGEGVLDGITKMNVSEPDTAYVCLESSLPVELVQFGVKTDNRDLVLNWTTASETNNAGFAVEHRLADETVFREVDYVEGAGTSFATRTYSYRLADPGPGRHAVRLRQIDLDGTATYSSVLLVEVEVPGDYYLTAAYPNPLTTSATVEFAVPTAQDIVLVLIDVQGRPVRTVFDGRLEGNARRKISVDAAGLASGMYFLRMTGDRFQATETITVAK